MPILTSLSEPSDWRWHILGQKLPEGTECLFTAKIENGFGSVSRLNTSCTIGGNESSVMPVTCSESNDSQSCACQCSEGFAANQEVPKSLTCKSKTAPQFRGTVRYIM